MQGLSQYLWSHVADLVFDCFFVANHGKGNMLDGLKDCAAWLGQSARYGLRSESRYQDSEPRLLQIRHFLGEIERQLLLANGLGAINDKVYAKLERRTVALIKAFDHPRVKAMFHLDGRPRRRTTHPLSKVLSSAS